MTNTWMDIKNADLIIVMGGNAAEAHPVGFKWVIEAKVKNKARLIVVDPRFTRTASVADFYCPIRPGTDIAFLSGVTRYPLENDKIHHEYVTAYTNASYVVRDGFEFNEGLFSGYHEDKRAYDTASWEYEIGDDGFAVTDPTMQHPRCVVQLLRKHVEAFTPEMVERICGSPKDKFLKVCEMIASCSTPNRVMTSLYALGWTQHSKGAQNIRAMCIVQSLLGNVGMPGGGVNALRGHSNIQGLTDLGLLSELMPGYLDLPTDADKDIGGYMSRHAFKPLRPGQTSYWQNYPKFFVSLMKAVWGKAATADNNWAFDYLPKRDVPTYDILRAFDLAKQGKMNGYVMQGFNPLMTFPNKAKMTEGLSRLKFLVVMDPLQTETARFWENHGVYNDVDPSKIETEVFQLPTTCFAEDEGSTTNSGRWLQWHWAAGSPPGEARNDVWIMAQLFLRLKALYEKEGGALPDPIVKLNWTYKDPGEPTPAELAREINGYAVSDLADPTDPAKVVLAAGKQLPSFAALKDDGSTACGCWIYSGCFTEAGNLMARRDNSDPEDAGLYPNWAFSWPVNRRILYNRASCDLKGQPWDPSRRIISWDGTKWSGLDVPDIAPTAKPDEVGPFIMNAEGTARLFALGLMKEGPFPVHYEPFESPVDNVIAPKIKGNPAARVFEDDAKQFGDAKEFPFAGTSYRLTEHFHFWTKHVWVNAVLQPEFFVEISEELAKEKGIQNAGWVRVWSKRGEVRAKALVTKRIRPLVCDGKTVHVVGVPLHWGFMGQAKKGFGPNSLTPVVGDANSETPEFKAFLVNIEPAPGPVA